GIHNQSGCRFPCARSVAERNKLVPFNAPTGGAPPADIWQQILSIMQGSGAAQGDAFSSPGQGGGTPPAGVVGPATTPAAVPGAGGGSSGGGGVYAPFGLN